MASFNRYIIVLAGAVAIIVATAIAAKIDYNKIYRDTRDISMQELNRMSYDCMMRGELDSSLVYSLMVVNRQPIHISHTDAEAITAAYIDLGNVYFMRSDFGKAQEMYLNALSLAEKHSLASLTIETNLANFYVEAGLPELALERYAKAFKESNAKGNWNIATVCYINMLEVATIHNRLADVDSCLTAINSSQLPDTLPATPYLTEASESYRMFRDGRYADAANKLAAAPAIFKDPTSNTRLRISSLVTASKMLMEGGMSERAVSILDSARTLSVDGEMYDNIQIADRLLAEAYRNSGNNVMAREHHIKSLELTDSLMSSRMVSMLTQSMSDFEISKLNDTISRMDQRRRSLTTTLIITTVALLVISLLLLRIFRQSKELDRNNRMLYSRNMDLINREKELLAALSASCDTSSKPKYQNSTLDEKEKQEIASSIRRVMVESSEIYSSEFSAERLAELVGKNFKNVSQVINEVYGVNFNGLLNQYRIKEACRRMVDFETYGEFTLEAIAAGVGFKSRSGFTKIFKQETGMLPSLFLKISKEKETSLSQTASH